MGGRHHCTQRATGIVMTHELIPQRVQVYVDNCIIAIGENKDPYCPHHSGTVQAAHTVGLQEQRSRRYAMKTLTSSSTGHWNLLRVLM